MISHRERLAASIAGETPDRPPVALWRHFPVDDQHPRTLASAILAFQRTYDFDLVKVTPSSSYCLTDWGARDEWRGNPEGTRDYTYRVIQNPDDWAALPVLDPRRGALGAELETLELLMQQIEPETPILQTIFSPLSQAKNLVGGGELLVHLRRYPDQLHAGLELITQTTIRYVEAVRRTGIGGVFYAVQHANYGLLSSGEFETFGRRYDLQVLAAVQDMDFRLLHLHGLDVMFDLVADYPVNILNWHDRETDPSLSLGKRRFTGAVCGGVNRHTLVYGAPDAVREEALEAIQSTEGLRFILGTGCVTPIIAPFGNLQAVRQSVED